MRSLAWIGRGFRGPLRDFLMADAVEPTHYGRAFGLERAGDMIGAVVGPLLAIALITAGVAFRGMLLIALIPGLAAAACVMFLVRERRFRPEGETRTIRGMHGSLPRRFRPLVAAILVFGIGDFSRSFLILAAAKASGAGGAVNLGWLAVAMPVAMYAAHNLISAVATFPAGRASDTFGRRRVLAVGYGLGLGCNVLLALGHGSLALVAAAFVVSGIYIAIEETAEKALVAEMLPREIRAYGLGILVAANAAGDMISSVGVGLLWDSIGAGAAFGAAAVFSGIGLLMLILWRGAGREDGPPPRSRRERLARPAWAKISARSRPTDAPRGDVRSGNPSPGPLPRDRGSAGWSRSGSVRRSLKFMDCLAISSDIKCAAFAGAGPGHQDGRQTPKATRHKGWIWVTMRVPWI